MFVISPALLNSYYDAINIIVPRSGPSRGMLTARPVLERYTTARGQTVHVSPRMAYEDVSSHYLASITKNA